MSTVHAVVPEGIDDPLRPSGGNRYDRRLLDVLAATGWSVVEHRVDPTSLAEALALVPEGGVVLVDGLIASAAPDPIVVATTRLRVVVLVHLPWGTDDPGLRAGEARMLASVAAVVATSDWTRRWLVEEYGLVADHVHTAAPGVDPAPVAPGTGSGGVLLCVAAVTPAKGHDVLLDALSEIAHLPWHCVCAGSLEVDPAFVADLRRRAEDRGVADRFVLTGPLSGNDLDAAYAGADLLVLPSRFETYGMVVVEALAHGLPVVASDTGGVSEALGAGPYDGPGELVSPGDATALAATVRAWLDDPALRLRRRNAARMRRQALGTWADTASAVAHVLAAVTR